MTVIITSLPNFPSSYFDLLLAASALPTPPILGDIREFYLKEEGKELTKKKGVGQPTRLSIFPDHKGALEKKGYI